MKHLLQLSLLLLAGGCASMNLKSSVPWLNDDKPQDTRPQRLVAIWTDTVLHTAGKPSTRGFGGRLYFYDQKSKAVPVEGTLVVYAYDDTRTGGTTREPDRKFIFRPEEFVKHADSTELGQSYSVWIPWDVLGGEQAEVTLIPMFTTSKGDVVAGEQSRLTLPGQPRADRGVAGGASGSQFAVQQASYLETEPGQDRASRSLQNDPRRMRTASIPMTDSLKQRLVESETAAADPPAQPYPFVPTDWGRMGVLRTTTGLGRGGSTRDAPPTSQQAAIGHPQSAPVTPQAYQRPYRTPGEAWEGETARIAAAMAEAQSVQRTAGWGLSRGPSLPGQPSSRSERMRSPVPAGAAATPIPGHSPWQPPHGLQPSVLPSAPGAFPPG